MCKFRRCAFLPLIRRLLNTKSTGDTSKPRGTPPLAGERWKRQQWKTLVQQESQTAPAETRRPVILTRTLTPLYWDSNGNDFSHIWSADDPTKRPDACWGRRKSISQSVDGVE